MTSDKNRYLPSPYDGRTRNIDAHRGQLRLRCGKDNRDAEIDRWINEGGALSPSELHWPNSERRPPFGSAMLLCH
jgi:hypothetical protein